MRFPHYGINVLVLYVFNGRNSKPYYYSTRILTYFIQSDASKSPTSDVTGICYSYSYEYGTVELCRARDAVVASSASLRLAGRSAHTRIVTAVQWSCHPLSCHLVTIKELPSYVPSLSISLTATRKLPEIEKFQGLRSFWRLH